MQRLLMIFAAVLLLFQIKYSSGCTPDPTPDTTPAPNNCVYGKNSSGCTDGNKAVISNLYVTVKPRTVNTTIYANWTLSDPECKGTNQTICFTSEPEDFCTTVDMTVTEVEIEVESCEQYFITATAASCGNLPECPQDKTFLTAFREPWITSDEAIVDFCGQTIEANFEDPCGTVTERRLIWTSPDSTKNNIIASASESTFFLNISDAQMNFKCPLEYMLSYNHPKHGLTNISQSLECRYIGVAHEGEYLLNFTSNDCLTISSVNYPADYENHLNRIIYFTGTEDVYAFFIEATLADEGDKIEIFIGDASVDPDSTIDINTPYAAAGYSGDGASLSIKFTTDGTGVAKGFLAVVHAKESTGGGPIGRVGAVFEDGFGGGGIGGGEGGVNSGERGAWERDTGNF